MSKKSLKIGFVFVILGGILSLLVAINLIGADTIHQLLAAYYGLIGAALLTLSFRLKRPHHHAAAAWTILILSCISLNPLSCIGAIIGLVSKHQ